MNQITNQKHNQEPSCADMILDRIEKEKVAPRGKWYFILKNEFFWGIGIVSVIIGSCSVAAALYAISNAEFSFYETTHGSMMSFLYDALPFMWLLSVAVFLAVGYLQIKHTSRGYRYSIYVIVGGTLVLTCVGGIGLHLAGFGKNIEQGIGPYMPFHKLPERQRQERWNNANRGVVAGEVISFEPDFSSFTIRDFTGHVWIVAGEDLTGNDTELLDINSMVRVIGLPTSTSTSSTVEQYATSTLHACFVIPWDPSEPFGHRPILNSSSTLPREANQINSLHDQVGPVPPSKENMNNAMVDERKKREGDITECKDIGPYKFIMKMRAEARD